MFFSNMWQLRIHKPNGMCACSRVFGFMFCMLATLHCTCSMQARSCLCCPVVGQNFKPTHHFPWDLLHSLATAMWIVQFFFKTTTIAFLQQSFGDWHGIISALVLSMTCTPLFSVTFIWLRRQMTCAFSWYQSVPRGDTLVRRWCP